MESWSGTEPEPKVCGGKVWTFKKIIIKIAIFWSIRERI